jgi:hypothetical protein
MPVRLASSATADMRIFDLGADHFGLIGMRDLCSGAGD